MIVIKKFYLKLKIKFYLKYKFSLLKMESYNIISTLYYKVRLNVIIIPLITS